MRNLLCITLFLALMIPRSTYAENQEQLVTLPIWESAQLTCKWWNANKGNADRNKIESIATAFMEGFNAGRSGTTKLYFVDGSKMGWFTGQNTAQMLSAIDQYCVEFAHETWTKALMLIYQKSLEPPLAASPTTK